MNRRTAGEHALLSGAVAAATHTGRARKLRSERKALTAELDAGLYTLTIWLQENYKRSSKPKPNAQCCGPQKHLPGTTVSLFPWRVNYTTKAMPATLRGRTRFPRTLFETLFSKNVIRNALL